MVRPYSHPAMNFFKLLPPQDQQGAINRLEDYLNICRQTHRSGDLIKDARLFVHQGLKHFKMSWDTKVEDCIQSQSLVEFYGLDHRQTFRTFNFFEFTSYTVEDIYCRFWFDLYRRNDEVNKTLFESVGPMFSGESLASVYFDADEHLVEERASLEMLRFWVKPSCVTPLMQQGTLRGYLTIVQVRRAGILS